MHTIEASAFEGCQHLATVVIPDNLYTVEENAFSGCDELRFLEYLGAPEEFSYISIASGNDALINAHGGGK
jgi:hypothetical protein